MVSTSLIPVFRTRLARLIALILASAFPLSGCGGGADTSKGGGSASSGGAVATEEDTVDVDGSSTVYPITTACQEGFRKEHPDVPVIVGNSGTGGGFTKYNRGEIDIVDASREAKASEESAAKAAGLDWSRFIVGYDGITVVVNSKNSFVKELSVEQLKTLFEPDSKVKNWHDLDPSWPDREIKFFTPDSKSGTFEFFTEKVTGKTGSQRKDITPSSDDNTLVIGVSGDEDAIGYFGYAYYAENQDKLRAIPIKPNATSDGVAPSPENILAKTYSPLSRPLFIYVKKKSYRRAGVKAFVDYYLKNVADLATKARYVAPTAEDIASNTALVRSIEGKPAEGKAPSTQPDEAKP